MSDSMAALQAQVRGLKAECARLHAERMELDRVRVALTNELSALRARAACQHSDAYRDGTGACDRCGAGMAAGEAM